MTGQLAILVWDEPRYGEPQALAFAWFLVACVISFDCRARGSG